MQTLVNAERYMTDELEAFEKELVAAAHKLEKLEREIFKEIIENVLTLAMPMAQMATDLAMLDNLQSLAYVSRQENFSIPKIFEDKKIINVEGAWHPLIKSVLQDHFVPHNLILDEKKFFGLITGPNMAGKTTVMREMAIIQFLAQIGCPVPAQSCQVGICDFLFSRLGASDDILKGQSTFMVEMSETAEIVRHATSKSLIILDEVGRGTSTYDGLSIAWSLVEHFLNQTQALCLFATHYHELIEVVQEHKNGKNLTVQTRSEKGNVQFLYRLIEAAATQSFGIYVAKLAGLPQSILKRSESILKQLEANPKNEINHIAPLVDAKPGTQLCFFNEDDLSDCESKTRIEYRTPEHLKKIEDELNGLDILHLTPWQAIQKIQAFKESLYT
jgi:DNA mismatch repair protein MutS